MSKVLFEGLVNFRDLGGLPVAGGGTVRRGVVYRSDSVAYASAADVARLTGDLGVKTVIDLRGEQEVAAFGRGPLAGAGVAYLSAPIVDVDADAEAVAYYLAVLEKRGRVLTGLLRRLADGSILPVVVHCEAGCDRTGVFAAMLLGLLGVPDDEVCADYALTAAAVTAINTRACEIMRRQGRDIPDGFPDESWAPKPATMATTLARIRQRWGGLVGWAAAYGLHRADLAALRTTLIERS